MSDPVLEPAAQAFADATANPPYLFDLGPNQGRKTVDEVQSPEGQVPGTTKGSLTEPALTIFRPAGAEGRIPVILYIHGTGWVFGNHHTHDRLARELAAGVGAAVVFPDYSLSPEAKYQNDTRELRGRPVGARARPRRVAHRGRR
jgi:acetyl esterase